MEYEASRRMPADSRIVFDVASDTSTMHRWLPEQIDVHEVAPGVTEAEGRFVGSKRERNGLVRSSPERLRLEWGSRGRPDYAGWLQVVDQADGTSEVVVHLSFLRDRPQSDGRGQIRKATLRLIERSLDRLAAEVGRRVGQPGG